MPTVFSYSSTPVYLLRFHSPPLSDLSAAGTRRAAASSRATASSAALTMFEVGAFTTITPAWVAALTSTLSRPTPARATTFSLCAAASASASTLVAERTRIASTSAIAVSSSARSAPLAFRISKSGPSASTVAGRQLLGDQHDRTGTGCCRGCHVKSSAVRAVGLGRFRAPRCARWTRCYRVGGHGPRTGSRYGRAQSVVHGRHDRSLVRAAATLAIRSSPSTRSRSYAMS